MKAHCDDCRSVVPCSRHGVLRFTVPGAPVPQARARSGKNGAHYTPERSRSYQELVAVHALVAMGQAKWKRGGEGPFAVELDVYRAAERGDVDNHSKSLLDSCTKAGVWKDDRYVTTLIVRLHVDKANPRAQVAIVTI